MATFDDRKKGFEGKFAHDREVEFRVIARRNRLLGLWVAGQMGMEGADADVYAREVVEADFEEKGEEDVFRKVWQDLQAHKSTVSEHRVRRQMADLLDEAREQIRTE